MPKLPINYQNAIVYKIVCKDLDVKECYVGSTTNFRKRKNLHKLASNTPSYRLNYYVYQFIRANGAWDNWDMVLIEKYPCECKLELHKRERYWIEKLHASLNNRIPTQSRKEYLENNKETIKEKQNKKHTCSCGGKYTYVNKLTHFKSKKHQRYLKLYQ